MILNFRQKENIEEQDALNPYPIYAQSENYDKQSLAFIIEEAKAYHFLEPCFPARTVNPSSSHCSSFGCKLPGIAPNILRDASNPEIT